MMFIRKIPLFFIVFLCVICSVSGAPQTGCTLNVTNEETEKFLPVPLYNLSSKYELVVPYKGSINLNKEERITLLCPGPKNYLTLTNSNITTISCIKGTTVGHFKQYRDFNFFQCKQIVKGEVQKSNEKCGKKGRVFKIGYQVTKKDWVTLIDVCHIPETGRTLYTQHDIHGAAIKYASKASYRPGFSTSGLSDDITASVAYKRPFQKATLSKVLKSARLSELYINEKSYLARGHLSPDADFLLATSQFSTYYYINTAPQWQSINGGNWKSIEITVRKLSAYFKTLKITTGTHEVLTYPDVNKNPSEIFLVSDTKLPVPKYLWKIIFDQDSQRGIALVIINDPYVKKVNESDVFCKNVCVENGFGNLAWKNIAKGYVFCCELKRFWKVVKSAPKLDVTGVLQGLI